jgi:hypothetical protein
MYTKQLLLLITAFAVIGSSACNSEPSAKKDEKPTAEVDKVDTMLIVERGKEIALATFEALSKELSEALKEGGVQKAIPYCSVNALPIADSLSKKYGVSIKRVTDRVRNPADSLDGIEKPVFAAYKAEVVSGGELKPRVVSDGDGTWFFAPIYINPFCTQCHGEVGKDLSEDDYALITSLYPADEAIGYKPGDLRGMWSLYFPKSTLPVGK